MTNSHPSRFSPRNEQTAKTLRDQLELEFVAIHQRRASVRRIARGSAIAILICGVAIGLLWSSKSWPGRENPGDRFAQGDGGSSHSPNAVSSPVYSAIKVIDLSDDELRSLLATTQAQWFVAEIDGTPTAFPLEPISHKPESGGSIN